MLKYAVVVMCCLVSLLSYGKEDDKPYLIVLGVAQDGGYPHAGCEKVCCAKARKKPANHRNVASVALVDPVQHKWWLFDATPDFPDQLHLFRQLTGAKFKYLPDGIFLTHAHIGHYTGLMHLGREVMGAKGVKVYVMPNMKSFLEQNGPWSQLVALHNIELVPIEDNIGAAGRTVLNEDNSIVVAPVSVPHRDEYSETVGFRITANDRKFLYIPDIDKWDKWGKNIVDEVSGVDYALLDGTFYRGDELPGRNMSEVPHPFVMETMKLFNERADKAVREKIYFIHLNHTNPLLWDQGKRSEVERQAYNIAREGQLIR